MMVNDVSGESLEQWLGTPLGQYLLTTELSCIDHEVSDVFGFHSVQLGLPEMDFLRANRIPYRCRIDPAGQAEIKADFEALPLLTQSVDLIVMPHVLEFSDNPHEVLREVARVLMPEGHVVVAGINPWSLWGMRQMFEPHRARFPWCGEFINLPRLKDWMKLLGFDLAAGRMRCYLPPTRRQEWLQRLGFLDAAGDRWWPFAGGLYILHGVKRVHGMRVITPRWRMAGVKSKALASVPRRVGEAAVTERSERESAGRDP